MSETLEIQSHKGPYTAHFADDGFDRLAELAAGDAHVLIDRRIAELYRDRLAPVLAGPSVLRIDASEDNKSLERFPGYVDHLVARGIRRDHVLIAVGGGTIQDITCFLAASLLRGVAWAFFPTTLLAQADSCIGSKSSINCGKTKNILGTFTPPREIHICVRFLDTLDELDVRSGVGEILKVHAIDGPASFDVLARDYESLFKDRAIMLRYVRRALEIKKVYIEKDEFDRGSRNVFNYGHSFGHAIEAATGFGVPHGIAVTIGMDMANFVAWRLGVAPESHFARMHSTLARNFLGYAGTPVPMDRFLDAIGRDKKNQGKGQVTLILPDAAGRVGRGAYPADAAFATACRDYLDKARAA